ncbi:hypothetical protein [Thermomonas mangrovi]|uniref:hypothetical protein n=1 Tax=Thermomonas mangrovi TaxID=2993316 RepID=UPI00230726CB|nr:hypothetical protein [Thermomonas mangrovi]
MEQQNARTAYRRAWGAYRRSIGPNARWDRQSSLSRSGRWPVYAPVNLDWRDALGYLSDGGILLLANAWRFPAPRDPRPLKSLAAAERRIAAARMPARGFDMVRFTNGLLAGNQSEIAAAMGVAA